MSWHDQQAEAGDAKIGGNYLDQAGLYNFEVIHAWDSGEAPEKHDDHEEAKNKERHGRYIGMYVRVLDEASPQKGSTIRFRINTGITKNGFDWQQSAAQAFGALGLFAEPDDDFDRDTPIAVSEFKGARFKGLVEEQMKDNKVQLNKQGKPFLNLAQFKVESVDAEYDTSETVRSLRVADDEDTAISVKHYEDEAARGGKKGKSSGSEAPPDEDDIPF